MNLKVLQKKFQFIKRNTASIEDVFPLLCPIRQHDWQEDWEASIVHSNSGFIEQDCVFTTSENGDNESVWQVTKYDAERYRLEMIRSMPNEYIVKINIQLHEIDEQSCATEVCYLYTYLKPQDYAFVENDLEDAFQASMLWWEEAINYYLQTGRKLKKPMAASA